MDQISDVQLKKIKHFFNVLDENGNKIIQPDDFVNVAYKICDILGIDKKGKECEHLIMQTNRIFVQIIADIGKDEDLPSITFDEWIDFFSKSLISTVPDREPLKGYITRVVFYIFDLFDRNKDNYIAYDEYVEMFRIYSIDQSYSEKAFNSLDRNGDKVISKQELAVAFREYFLSSDPDAPGNWIFGNWDY
jgi:Ca2+-binding EF-hand superfamily protein